MDVLVAMATCPVGGVCGVGAEWGEGVGGGFEGAEEGGAEEGGAEGGGGHG